MTEHDIDDLVEEVSRLSMTIEAFQTSILEHFNNRFDRLEHEFYRDSDEEETDFSAIPTHAESVSPLQSQRGTPIPAYVRNATPQQSRNNNTAARVSPQQPQRGPSIPAYVRNASPQQSRNNNTSNGRAFNGNCPPSESHVENQRRNIEKGYSVYFVGDEVRVVKANKSLYLIGRSDQYKIGTVRAITNCYVWIEIPGYQTNLKKEKHCVEHVNEDVRLKNWNELYNA